MPLLNISNFQTFQAINLKSDPGYDFKNTAIPNCAMVRLNWQLSNGRTGHNILHCQYTGSPALSAAVAQQIFAGISTGAAWTAMAAHIVTTTSLAGVSVMDVRDMISPMFNSTGAAVPGTGAAPGAPDEVALSIRFQSANRGRSGRGRAYQPGLLGADVAAGGVAAASLVTALTNWYTQAVGPTVASAIGPLVLGLHSRVAYVSPATGATIPARAATTLPIVSLTVDNHFDTQRRRGLK